MPHHSDPFLLQLLIIFISAKIVGELFEQAKLPAVLGEILAGVVMGPYAMNLVAPSETITSIANLGAIFLLFSVGLETQPKALLQVGKKAMWVAIGGVVLPFVAGYGFFKFEGASTGEAAFVGTALVATSVGITARVLGDMGKLQEYASRIILAAAVIDDVLGMILLGVVAGLAAAGGIQWMSIIVLIAEAVAFALFMIFVAPRLLRRAQPQMDRFRAANAPLILALLICLSLSVVAEKIGMAGIIGAFFAGLAFAELSTEWNLHARVGAITELTAPVFFFAMGAKLNARVFTGDVLYIAIIVSLLALASKLAGCGIPLLRDGWSTVLKVGVGMTPRGEVGLIIALIGLQMEIVSQKDYAVVMFMTAVTTLFAPPVLRLLFGRDSQSAPEPAVI